MSTPYSDATVPEDGMMVDDVGSHHKSFSREVHGGAIHAFKYSFYKKRPSLIYRGGRMRPVFQYVSHVFPAFAINTFASSTTELACRALYIPDCDCDPVRITEAMLLIESPHMDVPLKLHELVQLFPKLKGNIDIF